MKKNIGIFTYDFYPFIGGQGRNIMNIYNLLRKNNKVFVFSPCKNNLPENITIFEYTKNFGKNILFSVLLHFRIKEYIKDYKLDKVIFQGGPGGLLSIRNLHITQEYIANHTYYQQIKYLKPYQSWKKIFIPFEKRGYRNSSKIRSISESTKEVLINHYKIKPRKIYIEYPKTDSRFKSINGIKKIPNSLLFVGRLDERKGIDFLIKSMPLIIKKIPNIKLFVIGKGKLRKKLEKFIKKNSIRKNVKFLGFIRDKDLPKWYNQVELVIVPSVFEGFGITTIEAMACGTSVIGTDVDGIRDIIENNKNGILVKYGDKNELATQIIRLLSNSQLREKISEEGLKTVQSKFNWNEITQRTFQIYNQLLNKDG